MAARIAGHHAGLLRRLARLSGLIGVTLVFVANTQELTDRKEAHQAADTDEEADRIAEELDQSLKALAPLEAQYKETGTQVSGLFDMIEEQVAAQRDESRKLASFMDYVVYLLSAAGAGIAGFGNWLGARLPRAEGVPTQDVMAGV